MPIRKKKNSRKNSSAESTAKNSNYFNVSGDKKKKITGILIVLLSFFLLISILSFDRRDEAQLTTIFNDISNSFTERMETYNWLGVTGAHVSMFFVKNILGYFSVSVSFLLFLFGALFFRKINFRLFIHLSNFTLISALLLSSFFGVLRTNYNTFLSTY